MERKEVLQFIELQQRVSGMPDIERHMRVIEYAYIKKHFIEELGTIDLSTELDVLVKSVSGTYVEDFTPRTGRRSFLWLTWRHGMNCIAAASFPHQRTRHPVARV